jgi:hypothetical protein
MPTLSGVAHSLFSHGTMPDIDVLNGPHGEKNKTISIYSSHTISSLPTQSGMTGVEYGDEYQTTYGNIEYSYKQECQRQFEILACFSNHIEFFRGYWENRIASTPSQLGEQYIDSDDNDEDSTVASEFQNWDQLSMKLESTIQSYDLPLSFLGAPNLDRDVWIGELLRLMNYVLQDSNRFMLIRHGFIDIVRLIYSQYRYEGNINTSLPIVEFKFGASLDKLKSDRTNWEKDLEKFILTNSKLTPDMPYANLLDTSLTFETRWANPSSDIIVSIIAALNANGYNRIIAVGFEELIDVAYQLEISDGTTVNLRFRPWLAPHSM